jgi:hypothetical protein
MAEWLLDDRKSQRRPGAHRGEAVAQIMEADSIKACYLAYCVPRPLKVRARLSRFYAGYDVGIAVNPGQGRQDRCSRSRKVDQLSPGLFESGRNIIPRSRSTYSHMASRISRNRAPVSVSRRIAATAWRSSLRYRLLGLGACFALGFPSSTE